MTGGISVKDKCLNSLFILKIIFIFCQSNMTDVLQWVWARAVDLEDICRLQLLLR